MFCIYVIRDIRKEKNISLMELSEKAEISVTYLRELEANIKTNPSISTLYKIAEALEVNIKDLFYTSYDIDYLKDELDECIDAFGLQSAQVAKVSKIIDSIATFELNEKKNSKNITDKNSA